jgi:dTDP-4-dehydrorhamnose reductase
MKKSIFILGSEGLLGSALKKELRLNESKNFYTFTLAKKNSDFNLNLKNFSKLQKILCNNKIDILINCAAHTNLIECQKSYKKINKINVLLPKFLARLSLKLNFKLIHISSDSIYASAKKNKLNKENDKINYSNNYSKSKFFAERELSKKKHLILRSNFITMKKKSFPNFLLDKIKQNKHIYLYNDFYTSSLDLENYVKVLIKIIKSNLKGIYNIGSKDSISKKEFAIKFSKKINKKLIYSSISASKTKIISRNLNIGMNVSKLEKKLKVKMINSNQVIKNLIQNVNIRN